MQCPAEIPEHTDLGYFAVPGISGLPVAIPVKQNAHDIFCGIIGVNYRKINVKIGMSYQYFTLVSVFFDNMANALQDTGAI